MPVISQYVHAIACACIIDACAGLVAPVVGQTMFGASGEMMVALMILMAITSTGSAEVIAVTSILVYDMYQVYFKVSHLTPSLQHPN